jgi:hypothetical protein
MFAALIISRERTGKADSQDTSVGTVHSLSKEVLFQRPIALIVIKQCDILTVSLIRRSALHSLPYKPRKHQACPISFISMAE